MEINLSPSFNQKIGFIKQFSPNWFIFSQNDILTNDEVEELIKFDSYDNETKYEYFYNESNIISQILVKLLHRVVSDRILQYLLLLLDQLLLPQFQSIKYFLTIINKINLDFYSLLIIFIHKEDVFVSKLASRISCKLLTFGYHDYQYSFIVIFCNNIKKQIESPSNEDLLEDLSSCQLILRVSSIRIIFNNISLVKSLIVLLIKNAHFQTQYQIIFCIWLLAYESQIIPVLIEYKILMVFSDILKKTQKNKVIRIILATCRNFVEKSIQPNKICALMVYNKFIPILQSFQKRVFNDSDLEEDITILLNLLLQTVQELSTYDEYSGELLNGKLEWTPVHRSDKFWRENAHRLIENNCQLLNVLINNLSTTENSDPISISVACHDIGEFIRYFTRGKIFLQKYSAIDKILLLLNHNDQSVKSEALISLQKIMIHNWDYLGKKIPINTPITATTITSSTSTTTTTSTTNIDHNISSNSAN